MARAARAVLGDERDVGGLLVLDEEDEGKGGHDGAEDADTCGHEGVEGAGTDALTLVGLDVDHVVLLDIVGGALEDVGLGHVEEVLATGAVFLTEETDVVAMADVVDVATLGEDIDNGVALTGEGDDSGGLDGTDYGYAGVEETDSDLGVGDESLVDDVLLDEGGALFGGESGDVELADEGKDDVALAVEGEAIDGTELGVHALTGSGGGTYDYALGEVLEEFLVGTGELDVNLVGRLEAHLVLLEDALGLGVGIIGSLEIAYLLGADAPGETDQQEADGEEG